MVNLEVISQTVEIDLVNETIVLELPAVQGIGGVPGASSSNPPILFSATTGQTAFLVPRILPRPASAKLFVNGVQYSYGTSWNYNAGTSTLTWINSAFVLSGADEIVLYE